MNNVVMEKLTYARIIPLIAAEDKDTVLYTVNALAAGGITAVEIAFRTKGGEEALNNIASCINACIKTFPDILVGAGTVTNADLAKKAIDSGASFIVAPGFNHNTVNYCLKNGTAIIPGVSNPSLIETALEIGLDTLKFFPAEITGGVKWLKAMSGPFPNVRFVATGGINMSNAAIYLAASNCAAVCGSWIASCDAIEKKDWLGITDNARTSLAIIEDK